MRGAANVTIHAALRMETTWLEERARCLSSQRRRGVTDDFRHARQFLVSERNKQEERDPMNKDQNILPAKFLRAR